MKSKTKNVVALLATLAVGTAAVAGLAFGASNAFASAGLVAHADTEVEETIDFGENTLTLEAGATHTYGIASENAGLYGFEWVSGSAKVTISDDTNIYLLNEANTSFVVELAHPSNTEVTFESDADVELIFNLTYSVDYTEIAIGNNSVELKANEIENCIIVGNIEQIATAGYYTFTWESGYANFDFTYYGLGDEGEDAVTIVETHTLSTSEQSFTVYIASPTTSVIPVYADDNVTVKFTIAYSEALAGSNLVIGENTVKADGMGVEYTFTNTMRIPTTYTLTCDDDNAFIMVYVKMEYEDPDAGLEVSWGWEWIEDNTYTFTLNPFESIMFSMATNDWADDTYKVIIR